MLATSVSLLERLKNNPDEASWQRLDSLYRPLLCSWLLRMDASIHDEVHDLAQEVMSVLVQELPQFTPERPGSFRRWLREITLHRLQSFWRSRQRRPGSLVAELADPASDLNRQWDQEHDQYVLRRLLELLKGDFAPTTFLAFRRVVLDDAKPADVARELGLSVNAVLLAKSRVLSALRQEGRYLLD